MLRGHQSLLLPPRVHVHVVISGQELYRLLSVPSGVLSVLQVLYTLRSNVISKTKRIPAERQLQGVSSKHLIDEKIKTPKLKACPNPGGQQGSREGRELEAPNARAAREARAYQMGPDGSSQTQPASPCSALTTNQEGTASVQFLTLHFPTQTRSTFTQKHHAKLKKKSLV